MQVFGIVGWKNNGKTTLVERLISQLTLMGYKVSSVKHAHHDVDIDEPGRDSYRHRAAGAVETLLATEKRWALMHEYRDQEVPKLAQLLDVFEPCDIVIVEGYKNADHPKLEVVRNLNKGGFLADKMLNIVAIATDKKNLDITLPQLDINNIQQVAEFVIQHTGLMAKPAGRLKHPCRQKPATIATAQTSSYCLHLSCGNGCKMQFQPKSHVKTWLLASASTDV